MALRELLCAYGLQSLGECPDGDTKIVLIGPLEPAFWQIFTDSDEYNDGAGDPMDRWSQRVLAQIGATLGAEPLFPFTGPPFAPFFTWALKSGRFWTSPIGFLVHDQAGLFASFRGALRMPGKAQLQAPVNPCDSCPRPCTTACPVGAFAGGYNVAACKTHVQSQDGQDCRTGGCLARRACPIGQGDRLPAQSAFHMEAFL
ncbi:ferredoxin [Yoonia sp. BS5-3]|uniref:Ferredoxin n=1 Tax=Yoonia phaeophyticola TaxID=3137369 RepID=A0ABZ2VAD8_9RHOB